MHNREGAFPKVQFFLGNITAPDKQSGFRGIRTLEFKLAYFRKSASDSLKSYFFDLKKDPFELNNIFDLHSPKVDSMKTILRQWLKKTRDPFLLTERINSI